MKRIIVSLVATLTSSFAFCQEPTTVQKENLKGNVFSVMTSKYDYSENFGNPTEGKLLDLTVTIFDNYGRAVLYNYDTRNYGRGYGLVKYTTDSENKVANISMLSSDKNIKELSSINELINNHFLRECYFVKREIVYNNNIVVRHDIFIKSMPTSKYRLSFSKRAKLIGNGTYECKLYHGNGESYMDFKETYDTNGQLIELDNNRQFNNVYSYDNTIEIADAGKYQYNSKRQLTSYIPQKKNTREKKEYVYNDNGDIIQINTLVSKDKSDVYKKTGEVIYNDYKYDENGNWVYRVKSNGKKTLYIEKRQIEYCKTLEEIDSKVQDLYSKLPVNDMKAAEEFSDFYEKYLKGKGYTGQIPLIEYDSKYATVKNADKASVVVTVDFSDANCLGRQHLRLTMPEKYSFKLRKLSDEIKYEGSKEELKYEYKDGKLIMNNEEYVIDTSTGEMKNITRNFILKKE